MAAETTSLRRAAALLCLALLGPAIAGEREGVAVIVNRERRVELSMEDVAQIYLRRRRFWDDGAPVVPLNLPSATPLRERFSRVVLRENEARLGEYWNRQYFHGVLPPSVLASTAAVRRYVASDPNAIGYVPESEVDGSVRVLLRLE
jgi:ABC-type phosphate transport system substrate-binding protein